MVKIEQLPVCIDRYEATASSDRLCQGAIYGQRLDDYPPGFPDLVASTGCNGNCLGYQVSQPSTEVYACSIAGVKPSAYITYFQAKRACENSGKRLCLQNAWGDACIGAPQTLYPYGDAFDATRCNTQSTGSAPTGSFTACVGGFACLFDMSGNVMEWTPHCVGTYCYARGGYFAVAPQLATCPYEYGLSPDNSGDTTGFRCCQDLVVTP